MYVCMYIHEYMEPCIHTYILYKQYLMTELERDHTLQYLLSALRLGR